jgi:hypothetical protein
MRQIGEGEEESAGGYHEQCQYMSGASKGSGDNSEEGDDLETALANLEAGTIEALDIDVLRQTITFQIHLHWGNSLNSMWPSLRMLPRFT